MFSLQHAIIFSDRLSIVSNSHNRLWATTPKALKPYLDSEYFASSWRTNHTIGKGIRTRALKTRALKDSSPKNTIPNGHES